MATRQLPLPFEPPKRLNKQCQRILDRLQRGRVTNVELAAIAIRYSARIYDLRKQGYAIEIVQRNDETGVFVYELR